MAPPAVRLLRLSSALGLILFSVISQCEVDEAASVTAAFSVGDVVAKIEAAPRPTSTRRPPTQPLEVSEDGSCGNGITCLESEYGDCCSQFGWCGNTTDHCGLGCNPTFGYCDEVEPVATLTVTKTSTVIAQVTRTVLSTILTSITRLHTSTIFIPRTTSATVITIVPQTSEISVTKLVTSTVVLSATSTSVLNVERTSTVLETEKVTSTILQIPNSTSIILSTLFTTLSQNVTSTVLSTSVVLATSTLTVPSAQACFTSFANTTRPLLTGASSAP